MKGNCTQGSAGKASREQIARASECFRLCLCEKNEFAIVSLVEETSIGGVGKWADHDRC